MMLQGHGICRGIAPHVIRTWAENGYFRLHGHMFLEPGGLEVGEQPEIYRGYRGFSFLPHYWLYLLTGRMNVAYSVFYVLMTAVCAVSVWLFFGRNSRALLVAVAYVMSPGVVRPGVLDWDGVSGAVLMGLPVVVLFVKALEPGGKSRAFVLGACCCMAVYSRIEWANGFVIALGWLTLLVLLWGRNNGRLFWTAMFLGAMLLCGPISLIFQKAGVTTHSVGSLLMENTIGSTASSNPSYISPPPVAWTIAIKRLTFVNIIGPLPLWLLLVGAFIRVFRRERPAAICGLLPLVAGFGSILVLRNWMAAQQWDSTPIVCVALILSIYLMESAPSMALRPDVSPNVLLGWSFIFIVYSLLLAALFQINALERDTLVRLVEDHTAHNDVILVGPQLAPYFRRNMGPIDRKVVFEETVADRKTNALLRTPQFAVDSVPMPQFGTSIATAVVRKSTWPRRLLGWYSARITQRKLAQWSVDTYYLYKLSGSP